MLVLSAVAAAALGGRTGPATVDAATLTIGVDVTTSGNDASHLGTIDSCKRVEVDTDFDVDVYIANVTDLKAWELFFAFDGNLLTLTDQNPMMFTGLPVSDPVPDSGPHNHFLGWGDASTERQRLRCSRSPDFPRECGRHSAQPAFP